MLFTIFIVRTLKLAFITMATVNYVLFSPDRGRFPVATKMAATAGKTTARNCFCLVFNIVFAHYSLPTWCKSKKIRWEEVIKMD